MEYSTLRQPLSSTFTIVYKYFFPVVWIGGFGIGTLAVLFSKPDMAGGFILAFLLGYLICHWFCFPLMEVEVDDDFLYVSNYKKTIQIPHSNIENVTETPFINIHPIWIDFKTPTEFGDRIIFMPYFHIGSLLMMSHPAVSKLKELSKSSKK